MKWCAAEAGDKRENGLRRAPDLGAQLGWPAWTIREYKTQKHPPPNETAECCKDGDRTEHWPRQETRERILRAIFNSEWAEFSSANIKMTTNKAHAMREKDKWLVLSPNALLDIGP